MTELVSKKILSSTKSLFAMKTLKAHGMPVKEMQECYRATVLNSLLHAAPAWWGFMSAEDRSRFDSFHKKSVKAGYYHEVSPKKHETLLVVSKATCSTASHETENMSCAKGCRL